MKARVVDIIASAARLSGISEADITGPCRVRRIVRVRQACYLVAREQGHSYPLIAGRIGRKDHSAVIHGVGAATNHASRNPEFQRFIDRLRKDATRPYIRAAEGIKSRNDFTATTDEPATLQYRTGMVTGSALLAHALQEAMAA